MYFEDLKLRMTVQIAPAVITNLIQRNERNGLVEIIIEVCNQNGIYVLSNVTEAIVKCRCHQAKTERRK